jgi:hypothetical protein
MTDEATLRARHQRIAWSGSPDTCSECATIWPCDAIIALDIAKAERERADEAEALLHPIEWWYCVWCEVKYPYDDGPDTLKAHSATCEKHPANIAANDPIKPQPHAHMYTWGSSDVDSDTVPVGTPCVVCRATYRGPDHD